MYILLASKMKCEDVQSVGNTEKYSSSSPQSKSPSNKHFQLLGGPPWGFRTCGGRDTNIPLRIARVNPGSKSARAGVREGDLVIAINGTPTGHLTNGEAQVILKSSGPSLFLEVKSVRRMSSCEGVLAPVSSSNISLSASPSKQSQTQESRRKHSTGDAVDGPLCALGDPVWTPPGLVSPKTQKKFRPVNFNVNSLPSSSRPLNPPSSELSCLAGEVGEQKLIPGESGRESGDSYERIEPAKIISLKLDDGPVSTHQIHPSHSSQSVNLPKYQSPTVTLLQKAREGHLPKGALYLDHANRGIQRSSSATGGFSSFLPQQHATTGSLSITQQPTSLNANDRRLRSPFGRRTGSSLSEPEGYESDKTYKYATPHRRKFRDLYASDNECGRISKPSGACIEGNVHFTPGRIEDYTPGNSSVAAKEIRRHKLTLQWALGSKDLGYESDSNLVIKKRQEPEDIPPPPPFSPAEQRQVYVEIQKGGEVPLHGLRKPAPEKPKAPPVRYAESEVNIHYKAPVRLVEKDFIGEDELRRRQHLSMKRFYEEQRHRKFLAEIQDMENRRHMDNFTPSQKSPIPLNRYEDMTEEASSRNRRGRTPDQRIVARALYNFVSQNSRELSFHKGDVLYIRRKLDANWYEGEHNAEIGIFPASYVEIIPPDDVDSKMPNPSEGSAHVQFNFTAASPVEMTIIKGETVILTRLVDSNWYEGRIGCRRGIFPASYIRVLKEPTPDFNAFTSCKPSLLADENYYSNNRREYLYKSNNDYTDSDGPSLRGNSDRQHSHIPSYRGNVIGRTIQSSGQDQTRSPTCSKTLTIDTRTESLPCKAIYNYRPVHEDELELMENDIVHVLEKCDDGWYVGTSTRTGFFGTFPGNYVEQIF